MKLNKLSPYSCFLYFCLSTTTTTAHEQGATRQTCDDHCCSMGNKTIHIKYYPERKELDQAGRVCTRQNSVLLTESMYESMKTCIHEYLKNQKGNPAGVWLGGQNADWVPVFSLTIKKDNKSTFGVLKEQGQYSSICIKQEAFKTFSLIIKENSPPHLKVFDLSTSVVFTHVSKGQNMTLKCEAEGIPAPSMIFRKNGKIMNSTQTSRASLTTEVSADRCGDLGTYTCENQNPNSFLRKSIEIIVPCDEEKVPNVHDGSVEGSPQLCPWEDKIKNITVTSGGHAFSFCVIANQSISDFLIFNNTDVFRNNNTRFEWICERIHGSHSYNITIIIKNITCLTSGELTIGICTTQGRDYRLNYTIIINIEVFSGNNKNGKDPDKSTPGTIQGIDHLAVTMPVSLATAAIVLVICCIVDVVIRVTRYRNGGLFDCTARNKGKVDGTYVEPYSVELSPSVSRYANIQETRSSEFELQTTVQTVNMYVNVTLNERAENPYELVE